MKKKLLIFALILWIPSSLVTAQSKIPLKLAIGNEATAIPFTRFFTTPVHPCFQTGTEFLHKSGPHYEFYQTANLGYIYHNHLYQGIYLNTGLGYDYYTADGGLISNAYDLNVFLTALFNGQIISQNSLAEMMNWQISIETDPEFFPLWYGLGIFKMETPWGDAYFHSGDAIGYYACMAYFPDRNTTICWAVKGNYGKIDEFTSTKNAMEKIFGTVL